MDNENTFILKRGDTYPAIEVLLEEFDTTTKAFKPVDLTNATVLFRYVNNGMMMVAAATIKFPADQADLTKRGIVSYLWASDGSDTDTVARNTCEWNVTFPGGRVATFPRGQTPDFNEIWVQDVLS